MYIDISIVILVSRPRLCLGIVNQRILNSYTHCESLRLEDQDPWRLVACEACAQLEGLQLWHHIDTNHPENGEKAKECLNVKPR